MTDTPPRRGPSFYLPLIGALLGIALLTVRLATLPTDQYGPLLFAVVFAVVVTAAVVGWHAFRIRGRMRAAAAAFPTAMLIPITIGAETGASSRLLARLLGDPKLTLKTDRYATIAVDAAGLHVVTGTRPPFGSIAAGDVRLRGVRRIQVGIRRLDAVELEVSTDEERVPLPLTPMRLLGNPLSALTDSELHEVIERVQKALAGERVAPGWGY